MLASPIIFGQDHHTGIPEAYTYGASESSVSTEVGRTTGLSRVLSVKGVRSEQEVLAGVASVAAKGGRVFWSGGDIAKNSAMNFAKANGMKTLEMTTSGRIMNTVSPYLPRSISSPIWDGLSKNFARGATGSINVFQNVAGVSLKSTWRRIEYPILQNNNIIFHTVK